MQITEKNSVNLFPCFLSLLKLHKENALKNEGIGSRKVQKDNTFIV